MNRPSSTTIMHAMAFVPPERYMLGGVSSLLRQWGYPSKILGVHHLSGAAFHALPYRSLWLDKFHFSIKRCGQLRMTDWVECYGTKNGLPFVINHRVGECKR